MSPKVSPNVYKASAGGRSPSHHPAGHTGQLWDPFFRLNAAEPKPWCSLHHASQLGRRLFFAQLNLCRPQNIFLVALQVSELLFGKVPTMLCFFFSFAAAAEAAQWSSHGQMFTSSSCDSSTLFPASCRSTSLLVRKWVCLLSSSIMNV